LSSSNADRPANHSTDLEPFVSELARTWLHVTPDLRARQLVGTLVFADISGFTRLTERLAARGRFGAEEMSDHLDVVLSELLTAAYDHGGWLVKWGGDALLLMFDTADHALRACDAAAAMQSTMRRVGTLETSVGRVRLRMSIGIHTGMFSFHFLGQRHRELLITGDAATVTAALEAAAEAGDILVSPTTAELLPPVCLGDAKGPGILLVHPPRREVIDDLEPSPSVEVAGLIPELVLDHLVSGGGIGEHRQVTVAFLEFSGVSKLRGDSGDAAVDDALQHLVDVAQESCHRNIVSFHETDISADGGKIMLVAGAPRGLEDPAEAMLCALRQIFEDPGPLSVRAGVTAGRAFTGCVGPARRRSYSVKGDVVNLAARIMGKTPIGQIWALPVVAESSRTQFDLGEVPSFSVKGKVAPVVVRSVGLPLARIDVHGELPLIGRADEMNILDAALVQAREGTGEHIDLLGAPGIGKTRLLAELQRMAFDMRVVAAAAEPYRASSPYALAAPLLLDAIGAGEVATTALPDWLDEWTSQHAPDLTNWLPLVGPMLGISMADSAQTLDLAPEFRVDRLHTLVLDMLKASMPGPTLLVVDDMQFADEASEALLRDIAQQVASQPWLIVLAGRGDAPRPDLDGSVTLVIEPLGPVDAEVFIYADTDDAPLAPHIAGAVVARGGGNPLFLRHLAATARTARGTLDLPDTIETVVAARIDRLAPAAREVLRAAAVIGMAVDPDILGDLLNEDAARAVEYLGEFLSSDGGELRFRQAVIRDTAYEGLAFRRRAALHGRLAQLLTERHPDDLESIDAILSLHHFEAGKYDAALRTSRAAADRAADAHANTEAAALYRRAIAAADRLPGVDVAVRADLFERLGDVQVRLGEYDRGDLSHSTAARLLRTHPLVVARIGLKRARSAARTGGYGGSLRRLRRVAEALDGVGGQAAEDLRIEMAMSVAFTQFQQGRLAAARVGCQYVVEHGHARRTPAVVADALAILDVVDVNLGHPVDGRRARRALRLHQRRGDLAGQARVLTQIGYRAYFDGRWNDAIGFYSQARDLVQRLGDLSNVAVANGNIAEILLDQGRVDEAAVALREAIRVWRASGSENDVAFGRALLGRALARQRRYDDAEALLLQARARFVEQGAKMDVVDADVFHAECLLLRGDHVAALELAEASLVAAGRLSEQPAQAPLLYRVMGACHDALGNVHDADLAYEHALTVARQRGAAHEIAFTVAAMAERTRNAGLRVDDALLAEARPLQRRLGLVLDLTAAESTSVQSTTETSAEPSTMSADRLGFAVVPATA
jgi:class 3 adenylate cyclase/tetratricopeptide (TPR) repeat protein/ABC-type cobalamin transport system ATPase subunit